MDSIDKAVEIAARQLAFNPTSDVHTVSRGLKTVNGGILRGADGLPIECVVVSVGDKFSADVAAAQGRPVVPSSYCIDGVEVLTDVVESPPPHIARLDIRIGLPTPLAENDLQRCFPCPIPGGAQIAPKGAQYVGTLGSLFVFDGGTASDGKPWGVLYGALTNWHVGHSGIYPPGTYMQQPTGGGGDWFGRLHSWAPMNFSGGINKIDAAVINCRRKDGRYAPVTDTVKAEQFGLGKINPSPVAPAIGMRVCKAGRTTGVTRGVITNLNASTTVDYGESGAARFSGQIIIRSDSGQFSQAGDSGSLILEEGTMRPVGLLFAGGGRDTIANVIGDVVAHFNASFYRER